MVSKSHKSRKTRKSLKSRKSRKKSQIMSVNVVKYINMTVAITVTKRNVLE